MTLKNIIASCLVISLGAILAIHFILFWLYGGVFIYESNKIILTVESVMSVAILGFGIERLVSSANLRYQRRAPTISRDKTPEQSLTEQVASPIFLRGDSRATIPATTMATMMPAKTTLLIDSDARHVEKCTFTMGNPMGYSSDTFAHSIDIEHESTMHSEERYTQNI